MIKDCREASIPPGYLRYVYSNFGLRVIEITRTEILKIIFRVTTGIRIAGEIAKTFNRYVLDDQLEAKAFKAICAIFTIRAPIVSHSQVGRIIVISLLKSVAKEFIAIICASS